MAAVLRPIKLSWTPTSNSDKNYRMKSVPLLIGFILLNIHFAEAQQPKLPRIGFVGPASTSTVANRFNAFRQGLHELDYIEGKNIAIEYRSVEGKLERLQQVAAELVSRKVDVIVTHGEAAIRAFKRATTSIPIVVGVTGDLVVSGHAASLARPGGNITGLVDTSPELSGKRLEIVKDVLPQASRIAVLAMTDVLAKLPIGSGVITDAEFKQKLLDERAVYQRILYRQRNNQTEFQRHIRLNSLSSCLR